MSLLYKHFTAPSEIVRLLDKKNWTMRSLTYVFGFTNDTSTIRCLKNPHSNMKFKHITRLAIILEMDVHEVFRLAYRDRTNMVHNERRDKVIVKNAMDIYNKKKNRTNEEQKRKCREAKLGYIDWDDDMN